MKKDFINDIIYGGIDHDLDGDVDIMDAIIGDEIAESLSSHRTHYEFDEHDIAEMEDWERELNGIDEEEYKYCKIVVGMETEDSIDDDEIEERDEEDDENNSPVLSFKVSLDWGDEQKQRKDGLFKYLENGYWNFFKAIYDHFPEMKEDFAGDEEINISQFLFEIGEVNIERAIKYWKWAMDTFDAELINANKNKDEDRTCYEPGNSVLFLLLNSFGEEHGREIIDVIREEKYLKYVFADLGWEKHDSTSIGNILSDIYLNSTSSLMKKCYEMYLQHQKDKYTNRDLKNAWDTFLVFFEWREDGQEALNYIRDEMSKRGDFGKPIIRQIEKIEAKRKEDLQYEEEE